MRFGLIISSVFKRLELREKDVNVIDGLCRFFKEGVYG